MGAQTAARRFRRGGGRLRPERAGRRAGARLGRAERPGSRGRRDHRRWHPDRGADPARVPPRRLLGGAPDGPRLALLPRLRPGRARRTAVAAGDPVRPSARRGAGGAGLAGPGPHRRGAGSRRGGLAVPARAAGPTLVGRWSTRPCPTCAGVPRDPLAALLLGIRTLEQGTLAAAARFHTGEAAALLAGVAAHAIAPPAPARPGRGRPAAGHPRTRGRLAGPLRWQPGDHRRDGEPATATRRPGGSPATGSTTWPNCRRPARSCSTSPPPACCASPATGYPPAAVAQSAFLPVRRGRVQGRLRALRAGAVGGSGMRPRRHPAPGRLGHRGPGSPKPRWYAAGTRNVPTCSRCSPAWSTRPAHPPASRCSGRTRTCRTAPPRDVSDQIVAQVERFAPGFRDLILATHVVPAAQASRTTRTTSAGTSAAGRSLRGSW